MTVLAELLPIYAIAGITVAFITVLAIHSEATPGEAGDMLKHFPLLVIAFVLAAVFWPAFLLLVFFDKEA